MTYVIGIVGASGSGKSFFVKQLTEKFTGKISVLSQDNYYKLREIQQLDAKGIENFDRIEAVNIDRFASDLDALKSGKQISFREYIFNNPSRKPQTLTIVPTEIIIVEGIFILTYPQIVRQLDLKIFIETNKDLMLKRRIVRDQKERGYDRKDVIYRFEYHVMPAFEKHIEPFRKDADLIIPNYDNFDKALAVICNFIQSRL